MPSTPISSSSVGSVVGSCGQRLRRPAISGTNGVLAARVGGIVEAQLLLQRQRRFVHLPAGRAVHRAARCRTLRESARTARSICVRVQAASRRLTKSCQ